MPINGGNRNVISQRSQIREDKVCIRPASNFSLLRKFRNFSHQADGSVTIHWVKVLHPVFRHRTPLISLLFFLSAHLNRHLCFKVILESLCSRLVCGRVSFLSSFVTTITSSCWAFVIFLYFLLFFLVFCVFW